MFNPPSHASRPGAAASLGAAALLGLMCTLVAVSGVSQQWFESFHTPDEYAHALTSGARTLRWIIFFDDLFIPSYVTACLLFVRWLAGTGSEPLMRVVVGATLIAGTLDLLENHHILAMLRAAELGLLPAAGELSAQMVLSSLKWLLGHIAFALVGFSLRAETAALRALRAALIGVQLPLGIAVWTMPDAGSVLEWLRYGNMLAGFTGLALLMSHSATARADVAIDSGAPA